jgi:nitroreductase
MNMNDQVGISVVDAVKSRRSVRGFLDKPVDTDILKELLETALRAPSGTNIQPWHLHVLTGDTLKTFSKRMTQYFLDTSQDPAKSESWEYDYYPEHFPEPYLSRRRKVGFDLYSLAGVERGDIEGGLIQASLNYQFFGAPVGIIITVYPESATGVLVEVGCLLQTIMLTARQYGLHSCPQAAWAAFPEQVKEALDLANGEKVVVGIALGYEDPGVPVNQLVTERESLDDCASFYN